MSKPQMTGWWSATNKTMKRFSFIAAVLLCFVTVASAAIRPAQPGIGGGGDGGGPTNGITAATATNIVTANVQEANSFRYKSDYGRGPRQEAVDIILDTDIGGGDIDDFLDIWYANRLMDRGEVNLLAVLNSVTNGYGAPTAEAINRYFGRGHIPIGQSKETVPGGTTGYTYGFSTNWPNTLRDGTNAADSVTVLQTVLSNRPNRSVKLIVTGPLHQLSNLWGRASQLMSNKLSEVIIVAGSYPLSDSDFNLAAAPNAAKIVYSMRTVPVTWVGITNVGDEVSTGTSFSSKAPQNSPIYDALARYGASSRPAWAQMAIWYAARGTNFQGTNYFDVVNSGTNVIVTGAGSNYWQTLGSPLNEKYLVRTGNTNTFSSMIDNDLFEEFYVKTRKLPSGASGVLLGAPNTGSFESDVVMTRSGRGSGVLTLAGSLFANHFFFEPTQDTYLRGGFTGSSLFLNDSVGLGPIVAGNGTNKFKLMSVSTNALLYLDGDNSVQTASVSGLTFSGGVLSGSGGSGGTNFPNVNLLVGGTNLTLSAGVRKSYHNQTNGSHGINLNLAVPESGYEVTYSVSNSSGSDISVTFYTNSVQANPYDIATKTNANTFTASASAITEAKLKFIGGGIWVLESVKGPASILKFGTGIWSDTNGANGLDITPFTRRYTNYASASITINCATDVTANYTNAVAANNTITLATPVIGTSGSLGLVSDGSARTLAILAPVAITWMSTNDTASATNILTTASKRSIFAWRVGMGTDGVSTNIQAWVKNQTP